jgi:predicted outer membrane repeat protein
MKISGGKTLLKDNVTISGNSASYDDGGGIQLFAGDLTIQDNVSITGNTAKNFGGGLYLQEKNSSSTHTTLRIIGNALIANNTAKYGGGIYVGGSTDNYYGEHDLSLISWWQDEKATRTIIRGGTSVILEGNAAIKDNKATEGGGVYIAEGSILTEAVLDGLKKTGVITQKPGGFIMSGGTITGNKADYGAGVYAANSELSIPEQKAGYDNLYERFTVQNTGKQLIKPSFTFTGGSITGNEAEFVGGGIFVKNKGAYVPVKGTVTGNSAGDGEGEDVYQL